ncbi:TIGR03617 family F420-dependent LLM class oxidoreductase [Rhabdothermincola salaria]|uniref:TIGR03617 family F420-dependent LLM class oxidoreductase n=1 Tax=Rhabdothermincola salaria TaxID=2903142 RepID=UPI001E40E7C0|nr:TIGR03617 family F420-dependent LLM class oxidoreductase [Rhabdothermincola salaria]MCD9624686.1 TIGR03617 family F420-dependent LLM class oxidoreductase [Rhabdothermincola salaria]
MKVDLGVALSGPVGVADQARELTELGADGLFTFENAHDVFFPLVLASQAVDADLMTNVAMAFPRSPLHLAYGANDLQLLTEGRFRLGLGSQIKPHIEKRYGSRWGKPVAQMREWVQALNMMFDHFEGKGPFDFQGEYTRHTLMTPNFNPGPNPHGRPPVLVGALGPKMCEMTAEVADGILVMPFNSARHMNERTVPALQSGLRKAGRTGEELEVIAEVIVATGRDDAELAAAAAGVRYLLGFYGSTPSYKPVLDVEGWGEYQPRLNGLSKQGDWQGMADLITDDMVSTISVFGTPKQVAAEILDRFGPHASRVCCYFPGYDIDPETMAELLRAIKDGSAARDDLGGVRA